MRYLNDHEPRSVRRPSRRGVGVSAGRIEAIRQGLGHKAEPSGSVINDRTAPSPRQRVAQIDRSSHLPRVRSDRKRQHRGQGRTHPAGGELPRLVPGGRRARRAGRERPGAGNHGRSAVGLRDLGAHAGRHGPADQGDGRPERRVPPPHPDELPGEGEAARRGLLPGAGRGHPRRWGTARRAAGGAPHLRDGRQSLLRQVDPVPPGPTADAQPLEQRGPLGAAAAAVPAHHRVPLAGGPHRPRHLCGRGRGDPAHARGVPGVHGGDAGDLGRQRERSHRASASPAPTTRSPARR